MCMTKEELNKAITDLRGLKALKEETESEIRETERKIIEFLSETEECKTTDKNGKEVLQYIGTDYKATYSMQTREGVNKDAVKELLNEEEFESVKTECTFGVLRIK